MCLRSITLWIFAGDNYHAGLINLNGIKTHNKYSIINSTMKDILMTRKHNVKYTREKEDGDDDGRKEEEGKGKKKLMMERKKREEGKKEKKNIETGR